VLHELAVHATFYVPSPKRPASLVRVSARMSSTCIASRTSDAKFLLIYIACFFSDYGTLHFFHIKIQ
jgi:hypothetical protein